MSDLARRKKGVTIRQFDAGEVPGAWEELTDGRKADPADIATIRVDFEDWLRRLGRRQRRVAVRLAAGDSPSDAARHFRVSRARISQLRQELRQNWDRFQAVPSPSGYG